MFTIKSCLSRRGWRSSGITNSWSKAKYTQQKKSRSGARGPNGYKERKGVILVMTKRALDEGEEEQSKVLTRENNKKRS